MVQTHYVFLRGSVYYFRWSIPSSLRPFIGKSELKQSLHTGRKREAHVRGARLFLRVEALKNAYQSYKFGEITEEQFMSRLRWLQELPACIDGSAEPISQASAVGADSSPMLSEVYLQFIAYKCRGGLSVRIQEEYGRYWHILLQLMSDKPIASVTRKDIKSVLVTYADLPRRNLKQYKRVPPLDILEMDIPDEHKIAPKTVEQVKKLLQGLFVYATHELELITESPARDLNLKLSSSRTYAPYTDIEAKILLSSSDEAKHEWQKWMLLLGIYTGARRGELVKLRKQDIKCDADTRRYYLLITDEFGSVKTENAIRQVPVHSELLDAGFIDFVRNADSKLFPELKLQQVTSWFSRLRERMGVSSRDDYGNRKVYHSLRHSFITKARAVGIPVEKIQQVVGHERVSSGITDRYTHRFRLRDVLEVVDRITFK